jgi:TetR/AcrR family transcriptional regulator, fatty acid metabolism regulator protein
VQTIMSKRKLQSLETRKKIFDAAIDLIKTNGFDNVKIEQICKKANVSVGLFYNYFKSKDDIIIEQFSKVDNFYEELADRLYGKKGMNKLLGFVRLHLRLVPPFLGRDLLRNVFRSLIMTDQSSEKMIDRRRFVYGFILETVKEAQALNELPKISSKEIAEDILILLRGLIYNMLLYKPNFNAENAGFRIISSYIKGLQAK